ncbi:MAG TPA: polysaccharide biosynthesis tyrosine autokinase, partial [Anaerolineae bacterium]
RDTDPEEAALIANQVVEVLISHNEALQASLYSSSEESLQAQIAQIEAQIAALQSDIAQNSETSQELEQQALETQRQELESLIFDLQREITALTLEIEALSPAAPAGGEQPVLSPSQRDMLSEKRTELAQKEFNLDLARQRYFGLVLPQSNSANNSEQVRQSQQQAALSLYQQIYSTLLGNYEAVRLARLQSTANVVQVEQAVAPHNPVPPSPLAALGAAAGLIVAGAIAFLFEFLDNTMKTPEDIGRVLNLPVLGYVTHIPDLHKAPVRPYVAQRLQSPVAEAFRTLRVNLEFASMERPLRTILVTSAAPGEGKTTVLTNLAIVMAQAGHNVLLIDADLRRPTQQAVFRLPGQRGLTNLLLDYNADASDEAVRDLLNQAIQETTVDRLRVLTSGPVPPNPAELLGSKRMGQLLRQLEKTAGVVLIDSPPVAAADTLVMAAKVDGVVLVVQPGRTDVNVALAMMEQLERTNAPVIGVVLNRIPRNRADYYKLYREFYTSYYTRSGNGIRPRGPVRQSGGRHRLMPQPKEEEGTL